MKSDQYKWLITLTIFELSVVLFFKKISKLKSIEIIFCLPFLTSDEDDSEDSQKATPNARSSKINKWNVVREWAKRISQDGTDWPRIGNEYNPCDDCVSQKDSSELIQHEKVVNWSCL